MKIYEKKLSKGFIPITIIIAVAVLGLTLYSGYFSKTSQQSQVVRSEYEQAFVSENKVSLENRINALEKKLSDLDEKIKKSAQLSIEHLELSKNLQKQVNMLEFTQVRQNIDINILSNYCTPVAINSISEDIDRLRKSEAYSSDSLFSLENLFNYYIKNCK